MTIAIAARLPDGARRSVVVERGDLDRVAREAGDTGRLSALEREITRHLQMRGLELAAGERSRLAQVLLSYAGARLDVELACTTSSALGPAPDDLSRALQQPAAWLRYPEQPSEWLQRIRSVTAGLGYDMYHWRVGQGFTPSLRDPSNPNPTESRTAEPNDALDAAAAYVRRLSTTRKVVLLFQDLEFKEQQAYTRRDDARAAMQSLLEEVRKHVNVHVVVLNFDDDVPPQLTGEFELVRLPSTRSATPVLDKLGEDLTRKALAGQVAPIVGGESEVAQILRTLNVIPGQPNNVLLVGEPGVGKTALAEEVARRVAFDAVPAKLRGRRVVKIRANDLTADTSLAGTLEARVRDLIEEVRRNRERVILFIDEAHALFAQGGRGAPVVQALKEGWARGDLPTIAATTLAEASVLEADPAVESRFRRVTVPRPGPEQVDEILRVFGPHLQERHSLRSIDPSAYVEARQSADRYLAHEAPPRAPLRLLALAASRAELEQRDYLNGDLVLREVEEITRIPILPPTTAQRNELAQLEVTIEHDLHGQEEAIVAIADLIRGRRLRPPRRLRPLVVLCFGPSGTGKTETGRLLQKYVCDPALAPILFPMEQASSEFQVTSLIGAPPGYVGYDQGAALAERIAGRPNSVVIFDEIEKAHPQVVQALLQVLETGAYVDPRGRRGDYRSAIIVITSNVLENGEATGKSPADVRRLLVDAFMTPRAISQVPVGAAFVGRCQVLLPFKALSTEACELIAYDHLCRGISELQSDYEGVELRIAPGAEQRLVRSRYDARQNARPIVDAANEAIGAATGLVVRQEDPAVRILIDWERDRPGVKVVA